MSASPPSATAVAVAVADDDDDDPSVRTTRVHFGPLVGNTPVMKRLFARLERAAASRANVMIVGEAGTGKELVARELLRRSHCPSDERTTIRCSVAPASVGGDVGFAFPDAGVVFLDEVDALSDEAQASLLHVLRGAGRGAVPSQGSVRVIASSCVDLRAEAAAGRFRIDLYHRLAVLDVVVPPLRARLDDLEVLLRALLPLESQAPIAPHVLQRLRARPWPDNVRGLASWGRKNLRATIAIPPMALARRRSLAQFERSYLEDLLASSNGQFALAASRAEVTPRRLDALLDRHRLRTCVSGWASAVEAPGDPD